MHEIYASENGDRWFLTVDEAGQPSVAHRPNESSGGRESRQDVASFLKTNGPHTPQHAALMRLIGPLPVAAERRGD